MGLTSICVGESYLKSQDQRAGVLCKERIHGVCNQRCNVNRGAQQLHGALCKYVRKAPRQWLLQVSAIIWHGAPLLCCITILDII